MSVDGDKKSESKKVSQSASPRVARSVSKNGKKDD